MTDLKLRSKTFIFVLVFLCNWLQAQDYTMAYLNSGDDPSTIQYDNIVSSFHATMVRLSDNRVFTWGQFTANDGISHQATATEINEVNYPALQGEVLKFTSASDYLGSGTAIDIGHQFIVLTTTGLYIWGEEGVILNANLTTSRTCQLLNIGTFGVNGNAPRIGGLPAEVNPNDVKMLYATAKNLLITTNSGQLFAISQDGGMGNGTNQQTNIWHQVRTNATGNPYLSDVIVARGAGYGLMALTASGQLYTWGREAYLGNGSTSIVYRTFATPMTIPSGLTGSIKMIGATSTNLRPTYYILTTTGEVWSFGHNYYRSVGNFNTGATFSWARVRKSSAVNDFLTDIAWISPQEHDSGLGAINVLTNDAKIWAWGCNDLKMLGGGASLSIDPTFLPGGISSTERIIAVETGGHTSIIIKDCTNMFGYVGHRVYGSMADGDLGDHSGEPNYNFTTTAVLDIPGASSGQAFFYSDQPFIITGIPTQLYYGPLGGNFTILSGNATINSTGELTANEEGNIVIQYTFYSTNCDTSTAQITLIAENPLPINLIEFEAIMRGKTAFLKWTTVDEINNKGFTIQRSKDGYKWSDIGFVNWKANNGNSTQYTSYTFTDSSPLSGANYYRLSKTDFDGTIEYSLIRLLNFNENSNAIAVFPVPAKDEVTLSGLLGNEVIKLFNNEGKLIKEINAVDNIVTLNISDLANGMYHIRVISTEGALNTYKIMKTK